MKKRLGSIVVLIGLTAVLLLFLYDNNHGFVEVKTTELDRTKINNLRAINPETNKTYAQMLVKEIPKYRTVAKNFVLAQEYAPDYMLAETQAIEDANKTSTTSLYISVSTQEEIRVSVSYLQSATKAQTKWIESLNKYAAPTLAPSDRNGIIVGDVAVGSYKSLNFIRSNIKIRISGLNGNSVIEVAKEIDKQIIKALEDAKD